MNGDPKVKRFEAYASLRQSGDIQFTDEEMEKLLANEADRQSFHKYLDSQYEGTGSYAEWEAAWFPEYSKKKDYGAGSEPSSASSSATEPTPAIPAAADMGQQVTPKGILEAQGVSFVAPPQPVQKEVETPEMLEGMELGVMPESTATRDIAQMAQFNDIILERQQNYIKAIENVPASVLSDPARAFDLLVTDEAARKLHNDPNASDYIKGQIKARTITDAMDLVSARLSLVEQGLDEAKLDRYSNTKSALIQIYESGDPNMVIDGMNGAEWSQEWDYMLQSNDDLYEYDALNQAMYSLGKSYENIKGTNPTYFKEIEKQRNNQIVGDIYFRATSGGILKYPRLVGIAATNEVKSAIQGFMGFVGAVGNSFGNSAERYNWADKWAEKAARMDWGFRNSMPTFAQRDLFTSTARIGNYQVDIGTDGSVAAVRDSEGYLVAGSDIRNQVVEQYESAPDKYNATLRPHLAPAVSVAVQGAVQVAMTSKFAGLGRTAAAAKGYAAGMLTARFAGQNYIQALEEFGPENADVAARFAIATAALQSGISMYVNPLEIKLNPRFNVSPKTLKAVAKDLAEGKSKEAAIRNGFRGYSADMAKGMVQYTKEVTKEGFEGLMEYGVDVGGRMLVRSTTDINAEYDLSANAAANSFVSELIGASLAAGAAIDTRAAWQKESMLIAYENRAEILPMVEKMHGGEVAAKLKLALDAADKRMRGQKLTREQKNEIVVQEYNKTIAIDEEEAAPTPATQPEPAIQTQAEPEAEPVVEASKEVVSLPTIYDVAREEAVALRLEAGDSYKGSDGTPYTVVQEGDDTVTLRNEDDGRVFPRNKEELRKEIMTLYNQTYATAFPEMDFNQIGGIRRGMWEQASQGVLGLPSPAPVVAQPSQQSPSIKSELKSATDGLLLWNPFPKPDEVALHHWGTGLSFSLVDTNNAISNPVQTRRDDRGRVRSRTDYTSQRSKLEQDRAVLIDSLRKVLYQLTGDDKALSVDIERFYNRRFVDHRPDIDEVVQRLGLSPIKQEYIDEVVNPTQTIAPEAQVPAIAPAPTTETQAAPAEQQEAAETVSPVAPLVYNRATIEQAEGIDTAAIATALDVVSEIVPDMQVQVFETQAEMEAALGQRGNAFVSQDGKTIYISKESNAIDVQHEVIHPIMVAAELRNPGTIDLFYDQIMSRLPERVRDDLEVFQLGYSDKSQQEQREEVVVEFLARLASGQYEMTVFKQEGVLDAIINWFDAIFVKLGLTNPPNNLTDIKSFSRKIVEAFRTRAAVAFDTDIQGEMGGVEGIKARRVTQQQVTDVAAKIGISAKNIKDLYNINRELFGQDRIRSLAAAVVMDRMVGAMAKRAGVSKNAIYSKIKFEKGVGNVPAGVKFQVEAWHGSPYAFDKFSTDKIGAGEGVQAFGWGLYFTDVKSIAKFYADKLAKDEIKVGDEYWEYYPFDTFFDNPKQFVANILHERYQDLVDSMQDSDYKMELSDQGLIDAVVSEARMWLNEDKNAAIEAEATAEEISRIDQAIDILNEFQKKGISFNIKRKNLYRVSLHKGKSEGQYTWLEWDQPVSSAIQKKIVAVAKGRIPSQIMEAFDEGVALPRTYQVEELFYDEDDARLKTGEEVYNDLVELLGSDKDASLFLLAAGVDGVEYPAEMISMGATREDARGFNYVVFDESAVEIEEVIKYQRAAEKAQGAAMVGMDGEAVIYALTDPNVSTPLHEMAHVFEHYLSDAEKGTVKRAAGTKDWDTKTSEFFARGFEKYLAEGKAPNSTLQKIFDKFKQWLTDIYNGVFGSDIDVPINDDMRRIYASMLGEAAVTNIPAAKKEGEDLKARFTQDTLDPQYFRAKKWMRDEMNQKPPRLRNDIINDAIGIFGVNRGQAEIMYDVLWRSPDMKRMLIPPGVQTNRTGLAGMLDKAQQFRNEWLLKSQGMPMEVLRGLESALGENELLVRRMMESYGRVMKMIDKQPKDQRRDLRELANRFLDGRISDAQIASMHPPLYAELRQMRLRIDEVSAEILNDANMSEMRTEIIGANMGEYIGRYFRVHLFGKYKPETASIKKFMDEYRRRNYDALAIANPTWTADEIDAHLKYKGEQAYKDLLQKHAIDTKTGGQRTSKISKPTGMMKEREQLPKRAGDLWEAIDEQKWGPMTLPPAPGPVAGTGNPEFEAAFNAAWNDMRQYRLREAYFVHPQISAQFKKLEKVGEKLAKLTHSVGFTLTGTNPFSKENIRMAVENRTPFSFASLPPAATPAQIQQFNDMLNELNDGIVDISNRVRDRVNLDMDSIMANKNELDGTDGFRDLEHLTPGVRAILGEIAPLEATVITMANMARYYTMNKYYRTIRALGEGNFLFRADDPNRPTWVNKRIPGREQAVGMVPPDATTEKMAPLSGLYTTPEIYDILMNVEEFTNVNDMGFGMKAIYKFTGKVQEFKTIYSPQTQSRNFLSNTIFVVRNGWADPFRTAFALAYVPADMLLLRFTGKRLSDKDVGKIAPLKRMSDAFMYSLNQNFGDPTWFNNWVMGVKTVSGSNISKQLDANKYGFNPTVASDLSNFHAAKREMEAGMKRQETRNALVTDAVNNYGMSEDNARRLYADLQPKTFQDEMSEVLNKLSANGVLGTNMNMRIIQDYMGKMDTADKAVAYVTNHIIYEDASYFHRMGQRALKFRNNVNKFFADAYSFGDDTFKIFGYLQERADYSKLLFNKEYFLLSEQQQAEVDNIAMENVKNIIPNYDRIGKLGKYFSRSLVFAQFIAFKIESMRTWMNLFLLAKKEIADGRKSGNAAMVRHGAYRLVSHASMSLTTKAIQVSLAYGLGNAIKDIIGDYILVGLDDEDDEEKQATLRDPLPDYMKNDMLAASQPKDGKVTYISISANHPFGDFQRAINEWMIDEATTVYNQPHDVQVAALVAKEMFEQFLGVKIGTNVLIEMFTGLDNYGQPIYSKSTPDYAGDPMNVRISKLLSYALRRAGPGYISQLSRVGGWDKLFNLMRLPENEFLADFRKPVHAADWEYELLAMTSGYKPTTIDFYDQFKRRVGDFANYPGTQDEIYGKVEFWNLRIDDATFESQIKRMVEEEYATLASLHDAYRLPVKYGIVTAEKMNEVLTNDRKEGGVGLSGNLYNKNGTVNNNGRLTHMIAYGTYSAPWDKISDIVAKRQAKKPDYQYTQELDQWIKEFEMDKQQDENR